MDQAAERAYPCRPKKGADRVGGCRALPMWATLLLAFTLVLAGHTLAWAHVDPSAVLPSSQALPFESPATHPWFPSTLPVPAAIPVLPLVIILFGVTALIACKGMRQWGRPTALGLVVVLGVFTFATAVHAVHHLAEPGKAAECLVFGASQHVSGAAAEPCDLAAPELTLAASLFDITDRPARTPTFHPAQPRAPPSFPA
jgi:hypothetical protein